MTKWKVGDKALWRRRIKKPGPGLQRMKATDPKRYAIRTLTPVPVTIVAIGDRATDDAGPGSGGGSKIRIRRDDTKEETHVYAPNLSRRP